MTYKKYRRKSIYIRAEQQDHEFTLETQFGIVKGKAGDYIAIDEGNEKYPIAKEIFEKTYYERK